MQTNKTPQIGETIPFSGYNWRVLDIQDGQALLLSEFVLEKRAYHEKHKPIIWENCTLRHYLNNDFYNKLSEKNKIVQRTIKNHDNQWHNTEGGNDTTDNIFLLSLEELVQYFGDSGRLWKKDARLFDEQGNQIESWRFGDQFNQSRIARNTDGTPVWWWLRSPGYGGDGSVGDMFDQDGFSTDATGVWEDGFVNMDGWAIECAGGVRPALWLNL